MLTQKEIDERINDFNKDISNEFDTFYKSLERKFEYFPPVIKINVLSGILCVKLAEQAVIMRDNGFGMEAMMVKKAFFNIIEELDKTVVSDDDRAVIDQLFKTPIIY